MHGGKVRASFRQGIRMVRSKPFSPNWAASAASITAASAPASNALAPGNNLNDGRCNRGAGVAALLASACVEDFMIMTVRPDSGYVSYVSRALMLCYQP